MKHIKNSILLVVGLTFSMLTFAQQTCPSQVTKTAPDAQYTAHSNGTVTDTKAGLMWTRCAIGQDMKSKQCNGKAEFFDWQEALEQAQKANENKLLGYDDWRLPSVAELLTLVEHGCHGTLINLDSFPNTGPYRFFTSTPYAAVNESAWAVDFSSGYDFGYPKNSKAYVKLVRGEAK